LPDNEVTLLFLIIQNVKPRVYPHAGAFDNTCDHFLHFYTCYAYKSNKKEGSRVAQSEGNKPILLPEYQGATTKRTRHIAVNITE